MALVAKRTHSISLNSKGPMGLFSSFFNGSKEWRYHRSPLYMSKKDEEEGVEIRVIKGPGLGLLF